MIQLGLIVFACAIFVPAISAKSDFPSDIQQCKHSDDKCLINVITDILKTHAAKGHRGLNVIPFEPLHIKSLVLKRLADSPVNVQFDFKEIDLSGISQAVLSKISGFQKEAGDFVIELHGSIPKVVLNGPYSIDGHVLVLPITGSGNSRITFDDLAAHAKVKCTSVTKDGKVYLKLDKIHLDLQPKKVTFNLENLLNGNKELGDNMNKFLNENWETVYSELKPVMVEAIGKILLHIANGPFSKIPYEDLFLQS